MARPRSEDKRKAIMAAAIRVIVTQGLGAPTALLAKEAGVSNGTLFVYFKTKAELFNQLYLELKEEMASVLMHGVSEEPSLQSQFLHAWTNWINWTVKNSDKKRVIELLKVSEDITAETQQAAYKKMAAIEGLVEHCRLNGAMRDSPPAFIASIMGSLCDSTIEFVIKDPSNAEKHCRAGFDALWRAIG